jgi:hypothetical protein
MSDKRIWAQQEEVEMLLAEGVKSADESSSAVEGETMETTDLDRMGAVRHLTHSSAASQAVTISAICRSTFRRSKAGFSGAAGVVSSWLSRQTAQFCG